MRCVRSPIGLRYLSPAPELRALIPAYYLFHADVSRFADLMRADMGQLRFMLRGGGLYRFGDGQAELSPSIALIGPSFAATRIEIDGPVLVFGVVLSPVGWMTFIREDASRLADGLVAADTMFGATITDLCEGLRQSVDPAAMAVLVDTYLKSLLKSLPTPRSVWFADATETWLAGSGTPRVEDLAGATGLSTRQVERLSRRIFGAPPKLLARRRRAVQAAEALLSGPASWQDAAGEGFSDQSHFIREMRCFTGLTPSRLLREPSLFTRLLFSKKRGFRG